MKVIFPDLLQHQLEFLEDNTSRHLALVGGYGSGKTFTLALKLIMLSALNAGHEGAALSPTYGMAQKVLIPEIERQLRQSGLSYNYSKSFSTFDIAFGSQTTKLHILSAENYERVAGLNLAFGGFDEVDLMNMDVAYSAWRMLQSRLRSGKVFQLCAVSTPEGYNFLYDFFEKQKDKKDRRIIRARTRDNPFLPEEYVNSLLETYPANLIEAYLEGKFVNLASGNVYSEFNREANGTTQTIDDFPNHILHIGVDFNINNMAGVVSVIHNNQIYTLDEFSGVKDTTSLAKAIRAKYPQRPIYIYPDSSGKSAHSNSSFTDISILKDRLFGFEVFFNSKNPRVVDRVGSVNAKIKNAKGEIHYFMNPSTCPKLVEALEQQGWGKDGNPDKTTGLDHCLDALGYFIHFRYPITLRGTARQF